MASRDPYEWPAKVRRIVLLGSPNSGYQSKNLPKSWGWLYPFASGLGKFTIESVQEGAYWLANLRLRWLSTMRRMWATHTAEIEEWEKAKQGGKDTPEPLPPPLVVQVYGTRDDVVTTEDIDDSLYMPGTVRREMMDANHGQLIDLSDLSTADARWKVLDQAIHGELDGTDDYKPASPDPVYFILHGIRASAYDAWVGELTETLQPDQQSVDPVDRRPKVLSLNYRFFSSIEFALRGTRQRNIHQFLDLYLQAALTNDADGFRFIGHSNGTYMMASVMQKVPAVRFRHIMLAGSVLPSDFNWKALFDNGQIGYYDGGQWQPGRVHNDQARVDVPVGILANGLRVLGYRDIGAGGFRGFEGVNSTGVSYHPLHTFPKGHGAALMNHVGRKHNLPDYPARMPQIAAFLTDGTPCPEPKDTRSKGFAFLSRIAGLIIVVALLLILGLLALGFWGLLGWLGLIPAIAIYAIALILIYIGLRTV